MSKQEKHLLVLSDDDSIRRLFCDAFGRETVACEGVKNAKQAISRLLKRTYPIVVLDLAGGRASLDVIEFLQDNPSLKRPLIFVLAEDAASLPQNLDPRIVTMVITKPYDAEDIQAVIQQTLSSITSVASDDTLRNLGEAASAEAEKPPTEKAEVFDVLVVDDDRIVLNLIVAALERENVVTDTANDGAQAIGKMKKKRYSALVLDLMMPKMSGWDVIEWMKQHPHKVPYSVIVSTAADRSVLHKLDPEVVNAIFVKPFNPLELAAYVRACSTLRTRDRRSKRVIGAEREIRR